MEQDDTFRDRFDRLKGLCAFPIVPGSEEYEWTVTDFEDGSNLKKSRSKKSKMKSLKKAMDRKGTRRGIKGRNGTKSRGKKEDKSIFNKKGKSSMNYKFRAFTKSNQPNSFVTVEDANNNRNDHKSKLKSHEPHRSGTKLGNPSSSALMRRGGGGGHNHNHSRYGGGGGHDRYPMHNVNADDILIASDA